MKKIINGKKYDTETATKLGYYSNGLSGTDFANMSETLYRKDTGEYFLHGEGGAMSKYFKIRGNDKCGGEEITPFTEEEAKEWAERHLSADEYIAEFGEVSE